ncbi:hypothetical protein G6F57_005907 [Rhizopus arrhizus]|uniref:CAP-Gly domain-containing protein n=1 Tax=Rhizopus oryzae TaxID=64495 RepID=A0A9P7BXM1_RHIOR|nr:hypothetical protein G6F23_004470 [Rhizopus arrhizus]KAG0764054.1 hypothetical protein G6F24_005529 [Rhizopus arrhizus]KAG0784242.1 hypothetical protein G6F22_008385 [Rhizopus arrhizus]KAG0791831.1 hypothetical protein G6F21_004796 [Rhizopus arrhizus]KAG0811801.1 hypothetical protein G6F20_006877 [Rhizopus arrhizus]
MSRILKLPSLKSSSEDDKIGQRVILPTLDNVTGTLRYLGPIDSKQGTWAGIELDDVTLGKNDGSVQGKKYFKCAPNSGIFIASNKITFISPPSPPVAITPSVSTKRPTKKSTLKKVASQSKIAPLRKSTPPIPTTKRSIQPPAVKRLTQTPSSSLRTNQTPSPSNSSLKTSQTPSYKTSQTPSYKTSSTPSLSQTSSFKTSQTPSYKTSQTPSQQPKRLTRTPSSETTTPIETPPPPSPSPAAVAAAAAAAAAAEQKEKEEEQKRINEEKQLLYDMLEKVQRERDSLLREMKNKETAWERLLSSKESLRLQVEDNEVQCKRLSHELETIKLEKQRLEEDVKEREASIAKNVRDDERQVQDKRRIERLEALVSDLQQQLEQQQALQVQREREYAGTVEQMRKEVSSTEAMTASLEKECEDMRRTGIEAVRAVELSMTELKEQHARELREKEAHIEHLGLVVADLKHKQSTLFDDDELGIEEKLKEMNNAYQGDQRHRLEEQLELTMTELDSERHRIKALLHDIEQLKLELTQSRQHALSIEQKFQNLQTDFEKELEDKRRLVEESDHAFEAQTRAEEEYEQMKLSKITLEKQHGELLEAHRQLEQEHSKLMDEMLALESQEAAHLENGGDVVLQEKCKRLEAENKSQRDSLSVKDEQIRKLTKDVNQLEALVENKVFGDSELEEQLELEKKKVIALERELNQIKYNMMTTPKELDKYGHNSSRLYCENCDEYDDHNTQDCPNQDETF